MQEDTRIILVRAEYPTSNSWQLLCLASVCSRGYKRPREGRVPQVSIAACMGVLAPSPQRREEDRAPQLSIFVCARAQNGAIESRMLLSGWGGYEPLQSLFPLAGPSSLFYMTRERGRNTIEREGESDVSSQGGASFVLLDMGDPLPC
jgi:hypothetical protein